MGLRFLTAGESHGPALLVILEGLPAGLPLSVDAINHELMRRQLGYGSGARMKIERDRARLLGGVMGEMTNGGPLAMQIDNLDHAKWKGRPVEAFTSPRPGHADLTGALKYGFRDLRMALERSSARETASRVAAGAVCRQFLQQFGIEVSGYVSAIGEVEADLSGIPIEQRGRLAESSPVRCPDPAASDRMQERIKEVIQGRDTLGGVLEAVATGLPPGLGSYVHWDRRLEGRLGAAILSIPAVKGVEIGPAFQNARQTGTQVQDPVRLDGERLVRASNRAGGLEGGITNGEPLHVRAAMKPVATTLLSQPTVDLAAGAEVPTSYERSDFCPVPRAVPIVESMLAFVLSDALIEKIGGDSMEEMLPRFAGLRRARLGDLPMDGGEQVFWPAVDQDG